MPGVLLMPVSSPFSTSASVEGKGVKALLNQEVEGEVTFDSALASLVNQQNPAGKQMLEMDELLLEGKGDSQEEGGKSLPLDSLGLEVAVEETESEKGISSLISPSEKVTDHLVAAEDMLKDGRGESGNSASDIVLNEEGATEEESGTASNAASLGELAELADVKGKMAIQPVVSTVKSTIDQIKEGLQQVPLSPQAPTVLAANADSAKKDAIINAQPVSITPFNLLGQKNTESSKLTIDNQNGLDADGESEFEGDKPLQLTKSLKAIESAELKLPQDNLSLEKKLEMNMASLKRLKLSPQDHLPNSSSDKVSEDVGVKSSSFNRVLEQVATPKIDEPTKITPAVTVQTPMGKPGFAAELGQRMVMMISQKFQSAEIHVRPAELGPVDVRINFTKNQAEVIFSSQNAVTRETLEHSAPRLREMLEENGISLGNLEVQDQAAGRREGRDAFDELADADGESDESDSISPDEQRQQQGVYISRDRLVDFYA